MKYLLTITATLLFIACTNNKTAKEPAKSSLPLAPVSAEAIHDWIQSNTYHIERIATLSSFAMDSANPYTWYTDTAGLSKFEKDFFAERQAFTLAFTNDSVALIHDDGKTWSSIYKIDSARGDEEKAGWKLRFTYPDSTMGLNGSTEVMQFTSTYPVLGIDKQQLLLETPRSLNQRKVAVLLKAKH
jgi:hypothetical protein